MDEQVESLSELEVSTGGEVAVPHLGGSFLSTAGVGLPLWGVQPGDPAVIELAGHSS